MSASRQSAPEDLSPQLPTPAGEGSSGHEPMMMSVLSPAQRVRTLLSVLGRRGVRGEARRSLRPVLAELLGHPSAYVRAQALRGLVGVGPVRPNEVATELLSAVAERLLEPHAAVRVAAVRALRLLSRHHPDPAELVAVVLQHDDPHVRLAGLAALRVPPQTQVLLAWAVPTHMDRAVAWTQLLRSAVGSDREDAVLGLGLLRPMTPRVVSALVAALEDERAVVAEQASRALVRAGVQAVEPLTHLLAESARSPRSRALAAYTLGEIGEGARSAVPTLRKLAAVPNFLFPGAVAARWALQRLLGSV